MSLLYPLNFLPPCLPPVFLAASASRWTEAGSLSRSSRGLCSAGMTSDGAGRACGGLDWLVDVDFVFSTLPIVLALRNSEGGDLIQVWGCLYVSRLGLEWQWCWGSDVSIRSECPSPTWASILWSAGGALCRRLPILLCVHTALGSSRTIAQRPACGWSSSLSVSSADSGHSHGLYAFHVCGAG